jgi:hypothetical protein
VTLSEFRRDNIRQLLCKKGLTVYLVFLSMLLVSPALWNGWQLDDFVLRYYLLGFPDINGMKISPFNLFSFRNNTRLRIGQTRGK